MQCNRSCNANRELLKFSIYMNWSSGISQGWYSQKCTPPWSLTELKNDPFFAYQTQTVANPFHIIVDFAPTTPFAQRKYLSPKILTRHPFCTSWFFPSLSFYLSAIWSVTTSRKTQNTLLHNSSLPWKLVSYRPCVVFPYQKWRHFLMAKFAILPLYSCLSQEVIELLILGCLDFRPTN